LAGFSQQFATITDPFSGLIKNQQDNYQTTDSHLQDQISSLNSRISIMQTALTSQLEQADALAAELETQQNTLTATIQSLDFTSFGVPTGTSTSAG
jgi:flagellar capping protein FliD